MSERSLGERAALITSADGTQVTSEFRFATPDCAVISAGEGQFLHLSVNQSVRLPLTAQPDRKDIRRQYHTQHNLDRGDGVVRRCSMPAIPVWCNPSGIDVWLFFCVTYRPSGLAVLNGIETTCCLSCTVFRKESLLTTAMHPCSQASISEAQPLHAACHLPCLFVRLVRSLLFNHTRNLIITSCVPRPRERLFVSQEC